MPETTAVRERPILMSGPMVLALLEGRKTQTRRVVKLPVDFIGPGGCNGPNRDDPSCWGLADEYGDYWTLARDDRPLPCPYGQPGDRLWVRETWTPLTTTVGKVRYVMFKDGSHKSETGRYDPGLPMDQYAPGAFDGYKWKSSIHMPRWVSRITLDVTGVRVERLQAITEEDAKAEGVESVEAYRSLWDSLNGKAHPWASGPWVWVISFKVAAEGGAR